MFRYLIALSAVATVAAHSVDLSACNIANHCIGNLAAGLSSCEADHELAKCIHTSCLAQSQAIFAENWDLCYLDECTGCHPGTGPGPCQQFNGVCWAAAATKQCHPNVFPCLDPNTVVDPTCTDGIQNQGEVAIDCGGECDACISFGINGVNANGDYSIFDANDNLVASGTGGAGLSVAPNVAHTFKISAVPLLNIVVFNQWETASTVSFANAQASVTTVTFTAANDVTISARYHLPVQLVGGGTIGSFETWCVDDACGNNGKSVNTQAGSEHEITVTGLSPGKVIARWVIDPHLLVVARPAHNSVIVRVQDSIFNSGVSSITATVQLRDETNVDVSLLQEMTAALRSELGLAGKGEECFGGSPQQCGSDLLGEILRLAFHDAGTGDRANGTGGADGCLDVTLADHIGLLEPTEIVARLETVYTATRTGGSFQSRGVSRADFWVLAETMTVRIAGGPNLEYRMGRSDCVSANDHDLLPLANPVLGASTGEFTVLEHMQNDFFRMGFNNQDIAAMMGSHTLGRLQGANQGFTGQWVGANHLFRTDFYIRLLDLPWFLHNTAVNPVTGEDGTQENRIFNATEQWLPCQNIDGCDPAEDQPILLNVDVALVVEVDSCDVHPVVDRIAFGAGESFGIQHCDASPLLEFVMKYRNSEDDFFADYKIAFQKMVEFGASQYDLTAPVDEAVLNALVRGQPLPPV